MRDAIVPGLDIPLRTVFCIGRNYAEHSRELGNPVPAEPVVFLKPVSAVIGPGEPIELPSGIGRIDHEVELVVAIGSQGRDIAERDALAHVAGYGIGIDVTARDVQQRAKEKGLPWAVCKGYDTFAPVSRFIDAAQVPDPGALPLSLSVNGERRQSGSASDMLFPIPKLISYLSSIFTLAPGDLIFTGTPPGVSPLHPGDRLVAMLGEGGDFLCRLEVEAVARPTR